MKYYVESKKNNSDIITSTEFPDLELAKEYLEQIKTYSINNKRAFMETTISLIVYNPDTEFSGIIEELKFDSLGGLKNE